MFSHIHYNFIFSDYYSMTSVLCTPWVYTARRNRKIKRRRFPRAPQYYYNIGSIYDRYNNQYEQYA